MTSRIHEALKNAEEAREREIEALRKAEQERSETSATREMDTSSIFERAPALMPLKESVSGVFEPESALAGRMNVASRDLYEQLLFQSLVPAFDDVPLRRVFPFILYTPNGVNDFAVPLIVKASGCKLVHDYPFLAGSALSRGLLQTKNYQTRNQFENEQSQIVDELVERLKIFDAKAVTVNIYLGAGGAKHESSGEWTGKFQELTEALKNTLLIAAGCAVVFGGTLIHSKDTSESRKPHEVSVTQLDRDTQLRILPKILEATKAEDFPEIIESLQAPRPQIEKPKARPAQKVRKQ